MVNKYKEYTEEHPYAYVILIMVLSSLIGISIEYIVNENFIGSGIYTALALTLIELLRAKKRNKKED